MVHVLFVGQTGALGGAELVLLDIARHYGARCRVVLFTDGPLRQRLTSLGIATEVLAGGAALLRVRRESGCRAALRAAPAVLGMARRLIPFVKASDVLCPFSQKAAVITMLVGRLVGRPVVWHLHDILSDDHFGALQQRVVIALANRTVRRVVANSHAARNAFVAAGGDPRLAEVVWNGLDAGPFDAIEDGEVASTRRELADGTGPVLGLFGRLAPWKGQHVLLRALPCLPEARAVIVGESLFGEEAYKAHLFGLARELGVADRVRWLGFRDDVPLLMRAVDIVLHTSTAPEPFGRVIVEAMLARRPIVATNKGGAVELLERCDHELVGPDDPDALAGAIRRILATSPAEMSRRLEASRERARALFSVERMIEGMQRELLPA